jgi:Domain of unknown function (DUF4404)
MTQESLRELLARVHEHLSARGGALDRESQQMLATLMRDIEHALGAGAPEPAAARVARAHTPRLESLAVRFEAGHPALAETLRELIDALVKAGI